MRENKTKKGANKALGDLPALDCSACGVALEWRMATDERPFRYDLSGLDDAYLVGVKVARCPRCARESAMIPKLPTLHRVIADALFHKPGLLRGDEVRFLRKRTGKTGRDFAKLIGVSPEHLSRVENRHERAEALSAAVDRLVRFWGVALGSSKSAPTREAFERLAELIVNEDPRAHSEKLKALKNATQRLLLRAENGQWKVAA